MKNINHDKIFEAVGILKKHNQWRKGEAENMIRPQIVTEAIDEITDYLTLVFNIYSEYKAWENQKENNGPQN